MSRFSLPMRWTLWVAAPLWFTVAPPVVAQSIILPEGMAIQLQTKQEISSKTARVGDHVELAVAKPVTIGGVTLIAAGSPAVGEVTYVRDNGLLGRSGKLDIKVSRIRAGTMDVPVRGERNDKGRSGTLGAVGAGIVFLPLALIVHGREVKLPVGTAFQVYVDQEIRITSATPAPETAPSEPMPSEPPATPIRTIDPNQAAGI